MTTMWDAIIKSGGIVRRSAFSRRVAVDRYAADCLRSATAVREPLSIRDALSPAQRRASERPRPRSRSRLAPANQPRFTGNSIQSQPTLCLVSSERTIHCYTHVQLHCTHFKKNTLFRGRAYQTYKCKFTIIQITLQRAKYEYLRLDQRAFTNNYLQLCILDCET